MFEFDPAKSALNKDKHGIDFTEAQALWDDEDRIEAPADNRGEERLLTVGMIADRLWCAVFTMREEAVRVISVRRARENEVEEYGRRNEDKA
jgi:uncharacterized protein